MFSQAVVAAAGRVAQQELEPVMREEGIERMAQRVGQPLRRGRAGRDLGDQVEQGRHPLQLEGLGSVRRVPLPGESAESGREALRHELEHADADAVVAVLAEIGQEHEADVAAPEAHRHADDRCVSRVADNRLDQRELRRLELGGRERNGEVVLGQGLGPQQHRTTLAGKEPEAEQIVWQVGADSVRQDLVPGGEGEAVAEHLIQPQERDEWPGTGRLHGRQAEGRRCAECRAQGSCSAGVR